MRVRVFGGDGKTSLGEGELVGRVTVYFFQGGDELLSDTDPEESPSPELVAEMESLGYHVVEQPNNPKIVLDDGRVVYGCQVWWQPIREESETTDEESETELLRDLRAVPAGNTLTEVSCGEFRELLALAVGEVFDPDVAYRSGNKSDRVRAKKAYLLMLAIARDSRMLPTLLGGGWRRLVFRSLGNGHIDAEVEGL